MSKDNFNKYITQRTNRDCCLYSIVETIQSTSQLISKAELVNSILLNV